MTKKSFFKRNYKWIIPSLLIVIIGMVTLSLIGNRIPAFAAAYTNPELVDHAFLKAAENQNVIDLFGAPLTKKNLFEGEVIQKNEGKILEIYYPIKGSKRHGMLDIIAYFEQGTWHYHMIQVRTKGKNKETITIVPKP